MPLGIAHKIVQDAAMPTLQYIYSAHSAFAYLGSAQLSRLCAQYNVTLIHKPVLLTPVVEAQGSQPFRARTQAHVDYFFGREIERWAQFRDVPVVNFRPTYHDADYSLASGMILALGETGLKTDQMAHDLLQAHWRDDADLSNPQTLAKIATDLGHDSDVLMELAASESIQAKLQANSTWARDQNVFGSPTYILDGDPFYGQDHLELINHALSHPFSPTTWSNPAVN